jgi:hypothetical protein
MPSTPRVAYVAYECDNQTLYAIFFDVTARKLGGYFV